MSAEIKKDAWGKPIWNPADYPYVVRSLCQSDIPCNHGWVSRTVGFAYATYDEAKTIANVPMGPGEMKRSVQIIVDGKWKTIFERKRGGKIKETRPS